MTKLVAAQRDFVTLGPSHLVVLGLFAVGAVALVVLGRRCDDAQARVLARVMAAVMLAVFLAALTYKLANLDIGSSVPLQLCDVAELTVVYALWTQRPWACALVYYWGLLLSSQALLTPDVDGPDFPDHGFLTFFALHLLVVWSAVFLTWGRGASPRWPDFRFTVIVSLSWVAFTFTFNVLAGTNYGYLNHKPPSVSVLDLLGPWPWYAVVEIALVIAIWALMTWPWERVRERARVRVRARRDAAPRAPGAEM